MDKDNMSDGKQAQTVHELEAQLKMLARGNDSWESSSIEEKIERLRRTLQDLRWMLHHLHERTRGYETHKHAALGEVMVPLRDKDKWSLVAFDRQAKKGLA